MHLKSITLKGFKSFPDRTRLDFGPGVSVVVGPNGSGKSNVTDAVLWAMGEQSPLAVRGQSMQDVIFGGGRGVQARSSAEVEIVLDNSDGTVALPLSEISIVRRLQRAGEGGYWLNGARCRLTDVLELLSDTGLGKETHSVISQGRVEQIVTSRPRERRLLIEEAAGLGKHRKRRRRAQLKLERTQENLDRALDVEREARTRLRPLKRQAEAAQLHERLERQTLEARLQLAADRSRTRGLELGEAESRVAEARATQAEVQQRLQSMIDRRGIAERALAERAERHDALARRAYDARAGRERMELRAEQVGASIGLLLSRRERAELELRACDGVGEGGDLRPGTAAGEDRIASLRAELAQIETRHEQELGRELGELRVAGEREEALVRDLDARLDAARQARARADQLLAQARQGSVWSTTWEEVRRVIVEGVERVLGQADEHARKAAAAEVTEQAERVARGVVDYALKGVRAAEDVRDQAESDLREAERARAQAGEQQRRTQWLIAQRRAAPQQGPLAVRRAQLEGELAAALREHEREQRERAERVRRVERLRDQCASDTALLALGERLATALQGAAETLAARAVTLETGLAEDRAVGEQMASELRACAGAEAELQTQLRGASELVTGVEVAAQRLRDQAGEAELEYRGLCERLGLDVDAPPTTEDPQQADVGLSQEQVAALDLRVERLERRRGQLGPINPLAQQEYTEAVAHVEEMEGRRVDLETALRELRSVIREADRQIQETFEETFTAAARNFEELVGEVFPGGSGCLRLVSAEQSPSPVLGGQAPPSADAGEDHSDADETAAEAEAEAELARREEEELPGVEIEITPAGKSAKRLSLLSGGEKSMTALAFLFAVFLARPCPFYILDEVEAALDDLNLDRFLALLRRYSDRAQFIVITHQKRTMEAADWLYGVSMGEDGVSKLLSRRLDAEHSVAALA